MANIFIRYSVFGIRYSEIIGQLKGEIENASL